MSDTAIVPRDGHGRFLAGHSGNPAGFSGEQALAVREVAALARQHTGVAIGTLVEVAGDKKAPALARVRAAEVLLQRAAGQPAMVDATGLLEQLGVAPMRFRFEMGEVADTLDAEDAELEELNP